MTTEELKAILDSHAAWLRGEPGKRADLRGADLSETDLRGATLSSADLRVADLSRANFCGASLSGADLRSAEMRGANFSGADLHGAILSYADLRSADLRGTDLRGATLSGTDLSGADLRGSCVIESIGLTYGSVAWSGHGVWNRQLLCVVIDGVPMYFCGCFRGTADELQAYIDEDISFKGVAESRRKALWIVSDLISEVVCD